MDRDRPHLPDEQLLDPGLAQREAQHVAICDHCRLRLHDFERATAAYAEYHDQIRRPQMPPAPQPWLQLSALVARHEPEKSRRTVGWWAAWGGVAAACAVVWMMLSPPPAPSPLQADDLLNRSSLVTHQEARMISMRYHGRPVLRPAMLTAAYRETDPDLLRLRQIFATADYSWQEPLSVRSFQTWRGKLQAKRDSVTKLPAGYRVRTESASGMLRSVSLTLQAVDLRPVQGTFSFAGEPEIETTEVSNQVPPLPGRQALNAPEAPATPEDTLRVLAALNRIGADVGEPVSFVDDPQHRHVLLSVGSLSPDRQREVAAAVRQLPRVELLYDRVPAAEPDPSGAPAETSTSGMPVQLRKQFEGKVSGAIRLQELTDQVLDSSSLLLARGHAYQFLAERFPPAIEAHLTRTGRQLLADLRRRHLAAMAGLIAEIRATLQPILGPEAMATRSAVAEPTLTGLAGQIDAALNRLLAGSYSQSSGEAILAALPGQLDRLENMIRSQQLGGR